VECPSIGFVRVIVAARGSSSVTPTAKPAGTRPRHISLVALPDAAVSPLFGIYDVMKAHALMSPESGDDAPFQIDIVGEEEGRLKLSNDVPIDVPRAIESVDTTDIVIVPPVIVDGSGWQKGRYPRLVEWLRAMHERGAVICSACSGIFLIAETNLLDDKDATVHLDYASAFAAAFPRVAIHPERALVISGSRDELVTSGASTTWHDIVLYLIARYAGVTTAQGVARAFGLQWYQDGQL
jgi:transcriptional regulator GlxA family with amidase domain